MELNINTIAALTTDSRKYTNSYLTSGAAFKGTLDLLDTLPTSGSTGDFYIFVATGTNGSINFIAGDRYMKTPTGWDVIPKDSIVVNNYTTTFDNLALTQMDNGDGTIDIYVSYPDGEEPNMTGIPTPDGLELYIEQ